MQPSIKYESSLKEMYFACERLALLPKCGVFIPDRRILIVSDLHFEKGSFLRQNNNPIPNYDSLESLHLLEQLIDQFKPEKIIALGDSFHDKNSFDRLDENLIRRINKISDNCTMVWVLGNHDPEIPDFIKGQKVKNYRIGEISLNHEFDDTEEFQIVGHYHPKTKVKLTGQKISCKCFVASQNLIIMPSLGYYTGGLSVEHKAIQSLFAGGIKPKIYSIYRNKIY